MLGKPLPWRSTGKTIVKKITKGGQIPRLLHGFPPWDGYPALIDPASHSYADDVKEAQAPPGRSRISPAAPEFPDGRGNSLQTPPKLTRKIAEYIQEEWKKNLGIEVTLSNMEWEKPTCSREEKHNFTIARGRMDRRLSRSQHLPGHVPGSRFHRRKTGAENDGRYENDKYDELIEKAATMGPPVRPVFATLKEAEKLLHRRRPGCFFPFTSTLPTT